MRWSPGPFSPAALSPCCLCAISSLIKTHSLSLSLPLFVSSPLCSLRPGRVVVILQGRFAGRKAVILRTYEDGHGDRKFGHAVGEFLTSAV